MLVYDIEIIKAVPQKNIPASLDINYCENFQDYKNMGVSVIGAYDFQEDRYRVFTKDNWNEFKQIVHDGELMAGFNSIPFDNSVLRASEIVNIWDVQSYDLLREVWIAAGLGIEYEDPSHNGYSLDALAKANGLRGKTGNGATAPIDWQRGNIGTVIDYCLQDVAITTKLIRILLAGNPLIDPKTGNKLSVKPPKI